MEQNHITTDREIVYTFDTWEDYDDLMQHLEDEGITWIAGQKPTEWNWLKDSYGDAKKIVVGLKKGVLTYWYSAYLSSYKDCEKVHWRKI